MGKPRPPGPMPFVPSPWPKQNQLARSEGAVDALIGAFANGAIEVEEFEERVSDAVGLRPKALPPRRA
jgi:hypothetical protein